jgi:hypothetical protein
MPLNSAALAVEENPRPHLLGGDPEVFVKDKLTGKITPSCGKVGGKKGLGIPFGPKRTHIHPKMLEDNVTVEINFDPVIDYTQWMDWMAHIWNELQVTLFKKNLEPIPTSVHKFDPADLNMEGAYVFGCDPDFDAYDVTDSKRILDTSKLGTVRMCGGHLHLGYNNPYQIHPSAVAILCDMFLGLPSITYDTQGDRRRSYGLAGLYRPKPYGLEYRTMSNWWIRPENLNASTHMAREAFYIMNYVDTNLDGLAILFDKVPLADVKVAIDTENKKVARDVWYHARGVAQEQGLLLGQCFFPTNA